MSDSKDSGSLFDRVSKPAASADAPAATSTSETPSKTSWADEVASPAEEKKVAMKDENKSTSKPAADQLDGAAPGLGGSVLHDGQFDVEVKLSDMQSDESNPLYSVQSFEQLGM
jgi:ATP-dependent RNA helicase DDX19/DBP5